MEQKNLKERLEELQCYIVNASEACEAIIQLCTTITGDDQDTVGAIEGTATMTSFVLGHVVDELESIARQESRNIEHIKTAC